MSTEPSLLHNLKKDKPPKQWCVYFDDDEGEVITVTNKVRDEMKFPHFLTESDDARKILMGIVDPKKFSVLEDDNGYILAEKSAVVRIKSAENLLSVIPVNEKQKADVNIVMYINSWKMEVNFDQDTLYRMTGKRYFKQATINPEKSGKYDNITFYLIKNNDPNFLIKKIELDPAELIEQGYVVYDMSPFRNICGLGDMSVLTRKIFKTYRISKKTTFTGADYTSRRSLRRRHLVPDILNDQVDADFTLLHKNDGSTYIRSNFVDTASVKIYRNVGIYVTDKRDPNRLQGTITLDKKNLGYNSELEIDTELNLKESAFFLRDENRRLTIDMQQE